MKCLSCERRAQEIFAPSVIHYAALAGASCAKGGFRPTLEVIASQVELTASFQCA